MGTANGPEQRQLRPEPAGQTQPGQHSTVGVEISNVQGRGRGRKVTPQSCSSFYPPSSWSQQSCPIKSDHLVTKGICVHLLSRERLRWEPKQTPLHSWFRDTLSNPEKLMSNGKPALLPIPSCKRTVPWYTLSSCWGKPSSPTMCGSEVKLQISTAEKKRDAWKRGKRQRSPDGPPEPSGYFPPLNDSAKTKALSPEETREGRCSPGLSLGWC